ncbi:MAG: tetraacyldisaccharide 4'-kinase [Nitrospira sp.]|nr:tetraacyldisaccharide 4'-kinase [Nitrospira sp.]
MSGIGNSRSFRRSAESIGVEIMGESSFEDHHRYTHHEIEQIRNTMQITGSELVLTTEKDGGKLITISDAQRSVVDASAWNGGGVWRRTATHADHCAVIRGDYQSEAHA